MKMNLNKIGLTVRKNANIILSTILEVKTRKQPKIQETTKPINNFFTGKELQKALIETEVQRNYVYMYLQNFQKY